VGLPDAAVKERRPGGDGVGELGVVGQQWADDN